MNNTRRINTDLWCIQTKYENAKHARQRIERYALADSWVIRHMPENNRGFRIRSGSIEMSCNIAMVIVPLTSKRTACTNWCVHDIVSEFGMLCYVAESQNVQMPEPCFSKANIVTRVPNDVDWLWSSYVAYPKHKRR